MLDSVSTLWNVELAFLVVQAALLYRILRDLNLIDLDRLLAAIKAPSAGAAAKSGASACIGDEPITKEQRQIFVKLNRSDSPARGDDLLRVLFNTEFDEEAAAKMLASNRAWTDAVKPKQVTPAQLGASLQAGAWCLGGFTRCGWPIVELYAERWQPGEAYATEEARAALVGFAFEHALQRLPAGQDRLAVVADLSGWSMSHFPLVRSLVDAVQGPYVERLGVALFVNTPALFRASWALMKPLLSERVARRIFVLGDDWQQQVAEHVNEENLPLKLGGKYPAKGPPTFGFI